MSPIIATSWVISFIIFAMWVAIISAIVYIFKASVKHWNIGIPGQVFLLIMLLLFLLIPIRLCQIAFDAIVN